MRKTKPTALDFFSGSGLVTYGLRKDFSVSWANDICPKKADVYTTNHSDEHFHLADVTKVKGKDLPKASLSWASFPCQDLSLAGMLSGIKSKRSGLVWEWLRVMDEMSSRPPLLVAENVVGLVASRKGEDYKELHNALVQRNYRVGAIMLDAARWVPQSRKRIFVVAVDKGVRIPRKLTDFDPNWLHPAAVERAASGLPDWIWWKMPVPPKREKNLADVITRDAACQPPAVAAKNLSIVPARHKRMLTNGVDVAAGYKRTRQGCQVLELRFDGLAGCLRTPQGGSSRQYLVLRQDKKLCTRLLTIRELARLMGAPETYKLPGSYNDGYWAMGDAVAVPVAEYLSKHLLKPLAKVAHERRT